MEHVIASLGQMVCPFRFRMWEATIRGRLAAQREYCEPTRWGRTVGSHQSGVSGVSGESGVSGVSGVS
jgi:hypothetical protein